LRMAVDLARDQVGNVERPRHVDVFIDRRRR
jgi:hypothetical protein